MPLRLLTDPTRPEREPTGPSRPDRSGNRPEDICVWLKVEVFAWRPVANVIEHPEELDKRELSRARLFLCERVEIELVDWEEPVLGGLDRERPPPALPRADAHPVFASVPSISAIRHLTSAYGTIPPPPMGPVVW